MSVMSDDRPTKSRYPWLLAIGTVLVILGVVRLANDSPAVGGVLLVVGVLLVCTRLIQRSVERSR